MRGLEKFGLGAVFVAGLTGTVIAAPAPPDPSHIPFTLPADIKWQGDPANGEMQARLFGDPAKPGMYGILIKWLPGHYSHPHFHSTDRFVYVISGTWWVSSSGHYDPANTYPLPAGSFATDLANTVHWDGAKDTPAILELVGMGPVVTTAVKETK